MEKPLDSRSYVKWWNDNFDQKIDRQTEKRYRDARTHVRHVFRQSDEWNGLIHALHDYRAEYRRKRGYDLLMAEPEKTELYFKEWDDFIAKVWRKNVVENTRWDDQPEAGWITPDNWLERVNDIVRTLFVVKYFDGVRFLLERMYDHFKGTACECEIDWEAREEGYYAAHVCVRREYELPFGLETKKRNVSVEIQVTTQIKDVIRGLTHSYYEQRRKRTDTPDTKWQWDYACDEFAPNYIGHVLHYVEGAIMEIRDRRKVNAKKQ